MKRVGAELAGIRGSAAAVAGNGNAVVRSQCVWLLHPHLNQGASPLPRTGGHSTQAETEQPDVSIRSLRPGARCARVRQDPIAWGLLNSEEVT